MKPLKSKNDPSRISQKIEMKETVFEFGSVRKWVRFNVHLTCVEKREISGKVKIGNIEKQKNHSLDVFWNLDDTMWNANEGRWNSKSSSYPLEILFLCKTFLDIFRNLWWHHMIEQTLTRLNFITLDFRKEQTLIRLNCTTLDLWKNTGE